MLDINQICVTLWNVDHRKVWYIGYCKEIKENGGFIIECLDRVKNNSDLKWKYPSCNDICVAEAEQLLQIEIEGEWDVGNDRDMTFTLYNHEAINKKFIDIK